MSDLKLGADGDLAIENGRVPLTAGREAIAQKLGIHLKAIKGEWYQDQRIGFPWLEDVLGKGRTVQALQSLFRRHALAVPGVTAVDALDLDLDDATRSLTVSGRVSTTDGAVDFSTEIVL